MKFQVLLSCMHQNDFSIIHKSNLDKVACLMINQCNTENDYWDDKGPHRMYHTATRGLSVSRNLAVQYAEAKYCLISDDDEVFCDNLEETIVGAYERYPQADIIVFIMNNYPTKLGTKPRKLRKYDLLRVSSWQISFRLSAIQNKVFFDPKLGAGTGNGASEENKLLLDCYKKGMQIYYVPVEIASVAQEQSTWRSARDAKFFFNRGKTTRYILGLPVALLYAVYYIVVKRKLYRNDISIWGAARYILKGICAKSIDTEFR